jgi:hypothetical protein
MNVNDICVIIGLGWSAGGMGQWRGAAVTLEQKMVATRPVFIV